MNQQEVIITADYIRQKINQQIDCNFIEKLENAMTIYKNPLSNSLEVRKSSFNIFLL